MNKKTFGVTAVILSAICFGVTPMFMKIVIEEGANTISGAFYRFALTIVPLYAYLKVKKVPLAITGVQFLKICLITLAGYSATTLLLFFSYNYIPSGMATTIHFVYPVLVILASVIFFREKANPTKIFCALLCVAGIVLFYEMDGSINAVGIALAFASGCTYTLYTVMLGKTELGNMPTIKLIFYMNSVAAVEMFMVSTFTGEFTADLTPYGWFMAAVFALSLTFVGVLGYQIGVKYTGAQSTAILSTFEPITSVIIGIVLYQESFSPKALLGCGLILISTVIIARMKENVDEG